MAADKKWKKRPGLAHPKCFGESPMLTSLALSNQWTIPTLAAGNNPLYGDQRRRVRIQEQPQRVPRDGFFCRLTHLYKLAGLSLSTCPHHSILSNQMSSFYAWRNYIQWLLCNFLPFRPFVFDRLNRVNLLHNKTFRGALVTNWTPFDTLYQTEARSSKDVSGIPEIQFCFWLIVVMWPFPTNQMAWIPAWRKIMLKILHSIRSRI